MAEFIAIVSIVAGVLQIILFFKIWGMTNDVDLLKKKIVDHSHGDDIRKQCRKLIIMGRKDEAREIMIDLFCEEIEGDYEKLKYDLPALDDFKKKPISPRVEKLKRNLSGINETVPESLAKLTTIGDYMEMIKVEK